MFLFYSLVYASNQGWGYCKNLTMSPRLQAKDDPITRYFHLRVQLPLHARGGAARIRISFHGFSMSFLVEDEMSSCNVET
ncbi:Retrovirus-related Pol polyprotein from transposon TNT 1-94 [Fusarium oxysporum f. sp. albedinis]|nr:Retrovirus-related Pol polyprotein from transposon TNT 1-94 [Fusarium oxysporum f. sp. albedinis]KAK2475585.1 hypothetical protein H9L39_13178 [Fusarium oxysporum f. sp. albedinis]